MTVIELVLSAVAIVVAAALFTNAVEILGERLGLGQGAVGSVLAAVGTALPETVLPFVAILLGTRTGDEIGIGAILGAPFMLTTLAMFIVGLAVLIPSRVRRGNRSLRGDAGVLRHDLGYFVAMYGLAIVAGLWHFTPFKWVLALVLAVGYVFYVRRHFVGTREEKLEREAAGEVKPLYLRRLFRPRTGSRASEGGHSRRAVPPTWMSLVQVVLALALIIGGARLFVDGVDALADRFGISHLVFALLVAPVATELPEKFNSVLWARRGKDTLALGNLTGAMVFQSSFPVTIGLLMTDWRLSHESLVAALVGLGAGLALYLTMRLRGRFSGWLLLAQGAAYAGYVTYVLIVAT
jgi:cation:H+ antiporter